MSWKIVCNLYPPLGSVIVAAANAAASIVNGASQVGLALLLASLRFERLVEPVSREDLGATMLTDLGYVALSNSLCALLLQTSNLRPGR